METEQKKGTVNTRALILCAMFSALIAVGAFIRIPVPVVEFITLQTLFVNLAGLILGKKYGAVSVAVYIAAGLAGAPVFAAGGGPGYIVRPTFGYILGFLAGAFIAGLIREKSKKLSFGSLLLAGLASIGAIYLFGMTYLYLIRNLYLAAPLGLGELILMSFTLVLAGDIVICIVCALLALRLIPAVRPSAAN